MDLEFEGALSIWFDEVTGLFVTCYFALVRECQPFSHGLLDTIHYMEIKAQQLLKWTILIQMSLLKFHQGNFFKKCFPDVPN